MGLREFLVAAKSKLPDVHKHHNIHIVIGNESCDLDSAVSAITYAYFLHSTKRHSGVLYLPLLNIPRQQFRLRLETVFLLGKHGIRPDDLTFISDLDLPALTADPNVALEVTLVDHHQLAEQEECLGPAVVEVMGHRPQYGDLPDSWHAEIEGVGSCCSLVARRLLDSETFEFHPTVAELLLGVILVDTGNLSASDSVATPADHQVLVRLKAFLPPSTSATAIYEEIRDSKWDLSSLTVLEMLQKDAKILRGAHITVAVCSVNMDMEDILASPEFSHDTLAYTSSVEADVVIIMTAIMGVAGISRRCIAVFSTNRVYRDQFTDVLLRSTVPNLDLQPLTSTSHAENINVFIQNNLRVFRKGVIPLVREFMAGEMTTPDDESLNASGIGLGEDDEASTVSRLVAEGVPEEEVRKHINLAMTFQSDVFRTSQDRYDLAAVGTHAILSPSLSSDSELVSPKKFGANFLLEVEEDGGHSPDVSGKVSTTVHDLIDIGGDGDGVGVEVGAAKDLDEFEVGDDAVPHISDDLVEFDFMDDRSMEVNVASELLEPDFVSATDGHSENNDDAAGRPEVMGHDPPIINPPSTSDFFDVDVLQNHSPFDLLCPAVDSPGDYSSAPASGQGSKAPSYPVTPPNSYMEPSGGMVFKETQLPSFNSSEMVKRIREKKAALSGHVTKSKSDNFAYLFDDDDSLDGALLGGSSGGAGSLISPAVPQNSYVDLSERGFDAMSSSHQLPKLSNSDIMERVNEKRSQFEWSLESLDGSTSGIDVGTDLAENRPSSGKLGSSTEAFPLATSVDNVPYTPQNSYVGGDFDTYARANLTSLNSAEMVARIKAKQSAMFGGSSAGGSSRVSRSSDDSGGECRSPDIGGGGGGGGVGGRGWRSLDSPQQAFTPQNSYRDGLGLLDARNNKLPDLREVAERLSVEGVSRGHGKCSTGSSSNNSGGGGSRDEENTNNINNAPAFQLQHHLQQQQQLRQHQHRQTRNSSSLSADSQNTMSDVESLVSVGTDAGTPSENVVASGLAGMMMMRSSEMGMLSRKDTSDSEVFTPSKVEVESGVGSGVGAIADTPPKELQANGDVSQVNFSFDSSQPVNGDPIKELFSPVDSDQVITVEDRSFLNAAENIVASSIAAALRANQATGIDSCGTEFSRSGRVAFKDSDFGTRDSDEGLANGEINDGDELLPENNPDNLVALAISKDMEAGGDPLHLGSNQNHTNDTSFLSKSNCFTAGEELAAEENLADQALNELAFELANELIQSVLEDFPFSQQTGANSTTPASEAAQASGEGVKDIDDNESGLEQQEMFSENVLSNLTMTPSKASTVESNEAVSEMEGASSSISHVKCSDQQNVDGASDSFDADADDWAKRFEENVGSASGVVFVKDRKLSGSSESSTTSSSERKRSRDAEYVLPIKEGQVMTSFPDHRTSIAEINSDEGEDILKSFPGRKFSKSEDFPTRRFSRDDESRQSSELEEALNEDMMIPREGLETQYLPHVDPLQGSLDIFNSETSIGQITDVDREVVEGESFRKISNQGWTTAQDKDQEETTEEVKEKEQEVEEENIFERKVEEVQEHEGGSGGDKQKQKTKKKIRVSFSEDFDDEVGDFELSQRASLKSPPPPMRPQDSVSSTPPQTPLQFVSTSVPVYDGMSAVPAPPAPAVAEIATSQLQESSAPSGALSGGREVFMTTAGRISIPAEEEEEVDDYSSDDDDDDVDDVLGQPTTSPGRSGDAEATFARDSQVGHLAEPTLPAASTQNACVDVMSSQTTQPFTNATPSPTTTTTTATSAHPCTHPSPSNPENPPCSQRTESDPLHQTLLPSESSAALTADSSSADVVVVGEVVSQSSSSSLDRIPDTLTSNPSVVNPEPRVPSPPMPVVTSDPCVVTSNEPQHQPLQQQHHHHHETMTQPGGQPDLSDHHLQHHPLALTPSHTRNPSSTSFGSVKGAEYKDEWFDDSIAEVAGKPDISNTAIDSHDPLRRKIVPDSSFAEAIADDDDDDDDEIDDKDDDEADRDSEVGELEWENDTPIKSPRGAGPSHAFGGPVQAQGDPSPGQDGGQRWKRVSVSGSEFNIDLLAVEPYKNVLSHGGYYDEGLSAVLVFYGCHLPSRRQEDYSYIMNHLFHYVIHTLEELVADDYVIIYFHGSTPRKQMPGLGWLRRCYQSIDRRLKKNLKGLYLVHPTLWLRTVVTMIRPFISSKFSSKLRYVRTLEELNSMVPLAKVTIPEAIVQLEEKLKVNPHFLEEQDEEERRQAKREKEEEKKKAKKLKRDEKQRIRLEKKAEKERKKVLKKEKKKA